MESLKVMCHCSVNKEMRLYHERVNSIRPYNLVHSGINIAAKHCAWTLRTSRRNQTARNPTLTSPPETPRNTAPERCVLRVKTKPLEIKRSPPRPKHRETLRLNAAYIASKPNRSKSNAHPARSPLSIRNIYLFSGHSVSFSSNAFWAVPSNIPFPNWFLNRNLFL